MTMARIYDTSEIWFNTVNKENKEALSEWLRNNGVILEQINGQRIYGGPPAGWVGEAPPYGTEVFISGLPQEMYEDKLIPLFGAVGSLYEFRLMMTFSGLNRGFAYARYATRREAGLAIVRLNSYDIQQGYKITVRRSTEKCELMVDGIPCNVNQSTLTNVLHGKTAGVESVSLFASPTAESKNVAIVKYNSHKQAALAKKTLCEGARLLHGCPINVDWLKYQMRQKMLSHKLRQPHTAHPEICSSSSSSSSSGSNAQDLQVICEQRKLGQPTFYLQPLVMEGSGVLRFYYRVTIPGCPSPFTGYGWLQAAQLTSEEQYQRAKEIVSEQILKELGFDPI
ncbi:dead end protein homolog 1-like [Hyperolius riggenbachi]|uniref:dead end protein homolog 1-like n=1 Tax=Hyperolius riggenbachi TaxID=752182 RepID=UPI0035A3C7F6